MCHSVLRTSELDQKRRFASQSVTSSLPRSTDNHQAGMIGPIRASKRRGNNGATLTLIGLRGSAFWLVLTTGGQMPNARFAQTSDLERLLDLFQLSEVSSTAQPPDSAEHIWSETLTRKGVAVFVTDAGAKIAATCMLITAPNLLRSGRGHGFLENVVTHPEFRGMGHGRAVVQAALAEAWARDCYQVLLQSGRKDARVHRFYEGCGFEPGVRTAYVAKRPT